MEKSKWYDNKAVVLLLCFLFFPVGLYALWKSNTVSRGWKVGGSIIVGLVVFAALTDNERTERSSASDKTVEAATIEIVKEIRFPQSSGINIRTGPGTNYDIDDSGQLSQGETIYVLDEVEGWLKFRVTSEDIGWTGWVSKGLTISEDEANEARKRAAEANQRAVNAQQDKLVKELQDAGVVTRINTDNMEVFVNPAVWNRLSFEAKQHSAKLLGTYCGRIRGTGSSRVEIRDHFSGNRLARYSDNLGFRAD